MLSAVIPSELNYPAMQLASQPEHQWCVHSGPLVLGAAPLNLPTPTADRDRTVSRRSKPSSRTTLNGEQPYPWDLLQPQDVMSRHRGAKHRRRYELLGGISLLSPEYLLSVERWPFHSEPPDHYDLLSYLLEPSLSQSSYPPDTVLTPDYGAELEHQTLKGGISRLAPRELASSLQSLPPILHIKAQCSVSSYSKGSRGLSVLPRVHCIFTASSISLSLGWRQPGHHYAIRAGRNLPDKEFRYLRTVIVTAAVYRDFDQELLLTDNPIN